MRIKRFFAQDIRSAIKQVREALGEEAVILSNQQVQGGIEIVAAVEYDEALLDGLSHSGTEVTQAASAAQPAAREATQTSYINIADDSDAQAADHYQYDAGDSLPEVEKPRVVWSQDPALVEMKRELESLKGLVEHQLSGLAWGEVARRNPMRMRLLRHLLSMGLKPSLCNSIADEAGDDGDLNTNWRRCMGVLARMIETGGDSIPEEGGAVALIGPTGVGKTTTTAKLAARAVMRFGAREVALVTLDSFRIGAHDQLKIYGKILGVPVRIANDASELREALTAYASKRLVIIDSAGMSQRDKRLDEQLSILNGFPDINKYLVLSATAQYQGLAESLQAFGRQDIHGCILTKLDEATSLGAMLSLLIDNDLPASYFTDGQRVPEDIHIARANTLVHLAFEAMKRSGRSMADEWFEAAFGGTAVNGNG